MFKLNFEIQRHLTCLLSFTAMRIQLSRAAYDLLQKMDASYRMSEVRDKVIIAHDLI